MQTEYLWQLVSFVKLWRTTRMDNCSTSLVYPDILGVGTDLHDLLPSVPLYHMPYPDEVWLYGELSWSLGELHLQQLILHHPPCKRILSCGYQPGKIYILLCDSNHDIIIECIWACQRECTETCPVLSINEMSIHSFITANSSRYV